MDQKLAEIFVAPLADPDQTALLLLSAAAYQTEPDDVLDAELSPRPMAAIRAVASICRFPEWS